MTITLTVSGRIASVDATAHVVAGNTYPVALSLDSEWTGSLYLRVRFGSLYYDIPFASSDASVDVQMPVGYPEVGIGVFSEALQICTNEARIRLLRSILEAGEQVVEFDSDLYDQWAGEVSELLCDDAFDAESDRPVKNSVITAWKDTVPLDSALVHKTGNETIGGVKTFSEHLNLSKNLNQNSTLGYLEAGNKFQVACYDQKDNASNLFSLSYGAYNAGGAFNSMGTRLYKPDRSGYFAWDTRAYADHMLMMTQPYYPVDGQGNPQALTANALVASGNLAVDPRLVHTTGNETIAGTKTFTSLLTASNVAVKDASTPTVTMLKGSTEVANLASDGTQAGLTASSQFFGLRGLGTAPFGQSPSYTADNSADGKIVTRAMLAQSPTVVHTTGNEVVAGTKTFSNGINAYPAGWHTISKSMTVGQYCVFARINPANLGPGHFHIADFVQSSNTSNCYGRLMFKADRTGPMPMWIYRKNVGGNSPLDVGSIVVLADASTVYLAWKKTATYGTLVSREVMDINYGGPQSLGGASNIQYYAQADMTILDNLDGYTVYEVTE